MWQYGLGLVIARNHAITSPKASSIPEPVKIIASRFFAVSTFVALLGSRIGRSIFLALFAFQRVIEHALAAGRAGDPLADGPGGIVADVLIVSTGELGDPVPFFILVIANDGLFHQGTSLRLGAVVLLICVLYALYAMSS